MTCCVNVVFRGSGVRKGRSDLLRYTSSVLEAAMEDLGFEYGEVSVLFCSDREMQKLNREFREVDAPTDVLSFPATNDPGELENSDSPYLGDLAIALEYTLKHNVKTPGKKDAFANEVALLLVHGLLHLLGRDHGTKRDKARMWREQDRLLKLCADMSRPSIELSI